jgi:DNA-binding SARP family transcriptional activator
VLEIGLVHLRAGAGAGRPGAQIGGIDMARVDTGATHWDLTLFDEWRLRRGRREVHLHRRQQRLITLLAMQGSRPRGYVAGMLWPESTERHATGNLRAAVWHTDQQAPGLLAHDRSTLRIDAALRVDVDAFARCAFQVLSWRESSDPVDRAACLGSLPVLLRGELLPGWYDDWVVYERARLSQLRLRALQLLAEILTEEGEVAEALVAASAAVSIEPLHEPAMRSLVGAEIADGDYGGALRDYEAYRDRVQAELGVSPSARFEALVRPLLDGRRRRTGRPVVA